MTTRSVASFLVDTMRTKLGKGQHTLDSIYKATSRNWPFSRTARKSMIRATLQRNSADSPAYHGKSNLFRHYGTGVWGLRTR